MEFVIKSKDAEKEIINILRELPDGVLMFDRNFLKLHLINEICMSLLGWDSSFESQAEGTMMTESKLAISYK